MQKEKKKDKKKDKHDIGRENIHMLARHLKFLYNYRFTYK